MDFNSIYTKNIGNIGEAAAIAKFREFNIPVYLPYGDNEKVDMLAYFNDKFNRIQVKTCLNLRPDESSYEISLVSIHCNRNESRISFYDKDDIDYFVLYCVERGKCLLVPIEDVVNKRTLTIRFDKFSQKTSICEDQYEFEKIVGLTPIFKLAKQNKEYQDRICYCVDCGAVVSYGSSRCMSCSGKHKAKNKGQGPVNKITRDQLKELIRSESFISIGKRFNVKDNTIRKWCKTYNLPHRSCDIKKFSDEEWDTI